MTDTTADDALDEDIGDDESGDGGKKGGKKLFVIVGAVLVLLVGGAGAAYLTGMLDGLLGASEHAEEAPPPVVFYDLPEMVVNLASGRKKQTYLKIQLSLELDEGQDMAALERVLPRIVDHFQVYLREIRAEDLQGSAGIYRLKEELLRRVLSAARPVEVRDVLFKEMLIQ